jgi:membrane-bound inhibitor of C-type lysozyme
MKMKKILFSLAAAIMLVGCGDSTEVVKCGKYDVRMDQKEGSDGTLKVELNGDKVVLKRTISASGARYEGVLNETVVVLWNKGKDYTLFLNDDKPIECK